MDRRISVIVPVYKVETYLRRCVDSVLHQSFSDFELILVDDGSPDGCGAICDAYAREDARVRVIHRENGGLSAARNTGIDWAMSESDSRYLCFVDSDDYVDRRYLEALLSAAEGLSCAVAVCGIQKTGGEPLPGGALSEPRRMDAMDYYCQDIQTAVAWNKLYRKELFENVRYPVGRLHEDEFTTYRLLYGAGPVAVVASPLYAYFQNPAGITGGMWKPGRMDALDAFLEQAAFARERGEERLLRKAAQSLIYGACDQLSQADRVYRGKLRRYLRQGLKLGRVSGCFPWRKENLWAYEKAWPAKAVWWTIYNLQFTIHNGQ